MAEGAVGHFELLELIGQGSMGRVHRARDDRDGSIVALKVFYPDTTLAADQQEELRRRFEKEASILTTIEHENVVGVREIGTFNGQEYIAMEFLDGPNLKELLEMGVSFSLAEVIDIGVQVLSGLAACHTQGVIHRDIKPANVVKLPSGTVKLADFGIARILTDATISRTGTVVGTPNYMSPEQVRGEELSFSSDLFSLGVVLYELLTRHKPFDGDTITAIMYNVVNLTPPPVRFYDPDLPGSMEQMLKHALAKSTRDRYQNAREFQRDLLAVDARLPVEPAPPEEEALPEAKAVAKAQGAVIYCVDCGAPNDPKNLVCMDCHRPLLRRDMVRLDLGERVYQLAPEARFDRVLTGSLNLLLALIILFLIYLFFRG